MLPIWRALLPLAVFAAIGAALDRVLALDLGRGGGRWARWAACGVVATFAAALHPLVLAALVALALVGRVVNGPVVAPARQPVASGARAPKWWAIAAVLLGLVVVCRPATLAYWDSFVWLAKARIESDGWGALRNAALDRSADVVPSGYPLFWPLAASWLSMGGRTMEALAAGAAAMTIIALTLFLEAAYDAFEGSSVQRPRWAPVTLALIALTPLVFVHLRSAYADLPVGLLAATCTLRLARSFEARGFEARGFEARGVDGSGPGRGDLAVAAIAAVALAGLKDEGMAHVAALGVAAIAIKVRLRDRIPLGPGLTVLAAAAIPFNGWRMLLISHNVADADHRLSAPDFQSAGAIGHTIAMHVCDTRSWGALWPIAFACAALVLVRGRVFGAVTRFAALAFLAEGAVLASALLFGPARVRAFAFEGTLVNRLLLQLAPPAGVMVMLALADAAGAWQKVRRSSVPPISLASPHGAPVAALTRSRERMP
ncbi:MAG TPA: hypothetical protein VH044_01600 [Polyangiaceae bacterium]|jgi:hypothetical protein|nr:hypothetical protein [Polyangiaceae bacterium]